MRDPYEMLRRARKMLRQLAEDQPHLDNVATWLADYERLPGASLSEGAVHVLRDARLRTRENRDVVDGLLGDGYLDTVYNVRHSGMKTIVRCSVLGREALRLREDIPVLHGHERYAG